MAPYLRCLVAQAGNLPHAGLAVAAIRAGETGVLDLQHCEPGSALVAANLGQLADAARPDRRAGVKLSPAQVDSFGPMLETHCRDLKLLVVLADWGTADAALNLGRLAEHVRVEELLVEILDPGELEALEGLEATIDGLIAKGNEAPGVVGESSAFILLQRLVAETDLPVFVHGGVGHHTAAACRAGGAAGVVLDDQLHLLPESPLPGAWREQIATLSAQDTAVVGSGPGGGARVVLRPGFDAARELRAEAEGFDASGPAVERSTGAWSDRVEGAIGWGSPSERAWPVGQAVRLAESAREHVSTGRYVRSLLAASERNLISAAEQGVLGRHGPLAVSQGTEFPIAQGPMSRVSDLPAFAEAVADGGGLPFLAMGLSARAPATEMLEGTRDLLGERPWGIGTLGFLPQALQEEQLEVIRRIKPGFALIAGGRPDQAASLEEEGIATYIHAPTPELLRMFLRQGARRFIVEGRECGGHIGPLSSLVLWESAIEELLELDARTASEVHLFFAGGIHDRRSAAMVAALAAPATELGVKIGVLMGTAYLFTDEAVGTGALMPGFQREALACTRTVSLETSPGHASRCSESPFAEDFRRLRHELLASGTDPEEIRRALEELTLGRLRVAAKGKERQGDEILDVPPERQQAEGMFMIGQVATARRETSTIRDLHTEVSEGSVQLLRELTARDDQARSRTARRPEPLDIAVIGMGALFPKAFDPARYWSNIVGKVDAIGEVPEHRWDWHLYQSEGTGRGDFVTSHWGAFLDEVEFDPIAFGIPPASVRSIDPMQLLALEAASRAMADAGYPNGDFDRESTDVILGLSGGPGDLGQQYVARSELPRRVGAAGEVAFERLPEWTEESFPGLLANVTAGRIANRLDLGGMNLAVDAACASSLAALEVAASELESGRSTMVIAGAVDTLQGPFPYLCFSNTGALSPTGRVRTFDQEADGIVLGEAICMLVLKPLADAERDGDRIYSVIRGVGSSSDGRGLSLTAPASRGQIRALQRAWNRQGLDPRSLGLYEAHGTGTVLGDRTELESISNFLAQHGAEPHSCAVGSVKTLVGHTKSAAGMAGLMKVALALHHRVIPPHTNVESPLGELSSDESPIYLADEAKPWVVDGEAPRIGAVSAFGFGGTNFHAVLEEYRDPFRPAAQGATIWPQELLVWAASETTSLEDRLATTASLIEQGTVGSLRQLAAVLARERGGTGRRAAAVCGSLDEAIQSIAQLRRHLEGPADSKLPPTLVVGPESVEPPKGRVAFLFPGQASQYLNMAREVAIYLPPVLAALQEGDDALRQAFDVPLSRILMPPTAYDPATLAAQVNRLADTHVVQAALAIVEAGYLDLMDWLGVEPTFVAGHSFGEFTALHAGGAFSRRDFLRLAESRGRSMAVACNTEPGGMAAIQAPREAVERWVAEEPGVVLANCNGPQQNVISGPFDAVERIANRLASEGVTTRMLDVAGAFHSILMEPADPTLRAAIESVELRAPRIAVYTNADGAPYSSDPEAVRAHVADHLLSPVDWVGVIETMYGDGARLFVEVGPGSVLTGLTGRILGDRDARVVALDRRGGGLKSLLQGLGTLFVNGVDPALERLFDGRLEAPADLRNRRGAVPEANLWLVSGGEARRPDESPGAAGKQPPLNQKTYEMTRSELEMSKTRVSDAEELLGSAGPISDVAGSERAPLQGAGESPEVAILRAYSAHQELMTRFLEVEQDVMRQFSSLLTGEAAVPAVGQEIRERATVESPETEAGSPEAPQMQQDDGETEDTDAGTAQLTPDALLEILVGQVAARTGYPAEVLGVDQDMEADLGIDSIKRIEILGGLLDQLPEPVRVDLQAHVDEFTSARTMAELVDRLVERLPAGSGDPTPLPTTDSATVDENGPAVDRATLLREVVGVVSERTGYPTEVLGVDQEMEADLGIDSIKRVEILGGLLDRLPESHAHALQDRVDEFTQAKTIEELVDRLVAALQVDSGDAPQEDASEPEAARPAEAPIEIDLPVATLKRYVMSGEPTPLSDDHEVPVGHYVVTPDQDGKVAAAVSQRLADSGCQVSVISWDSLSDRERIGAELAEAREQHGEISGLLHLAPVSSASLPESIEEWRRLVAIQTKSLFHLVQLSGDDLRVGGRVLAVTSQDGAFGRTGAAPQATPTGGGCSGLLKTMEIEWPETSARLVDVDAIDGESLARICMAELAATDEDVEIGYRDGVRIAYGSVVETLPTTPEGGLSPTGEWVVLAIGGARGITHDLLREIVVDGVRLVLVGRSSFAATEESETASKTSVADLRRHLLEAAKAAGQEVTPAEIERRIALLLRDREIRDNLRELEALGARVEYHAVDVRDADALGGFVADVYERYGQIDAVINGAGVIEDKLLADKTVESFDRVFDTKVDSTFVLGSVLRPESLKLFVLMSSVAGRTGNRGQVDYAAANELMNRLAWSLRASWPEVRVAALNWGPWASSGMATAEVQQQFRARGVEPITTEEGRRAFREELAAGAVGDVEIVVGSFASQDASAEGLYPLLDESPVQTNGCLTGRRRFSLARDPYLRDHVLDGNPTVPAAFVMELMAEFVQEAWPEMVVAEVRDLRVQRGLVLKDGDDLEVALEARMSSHGTAEFLEVSVALRDVDADVARYRATVVLRPELTEPIGAASPITGEGLDPGECYRTYTFHGPSLQLITAIEAFSEAGVDCTMKSSGPRDVLGESRAADSAWLLEPVLMDGLLQAALIWIGRSHSEVALPNRFGRVVRYADRAPEGPLTVRARVKHFDQWKLVLDYTVSGADGSVFFAAFDIEATHSSALSRLLSTPRPTDELVKGVTP